MTRALLGSILIHSATIGAITTAAVILRPTILPSPSQMATLELVLGSGHDEKRTGSSQPTPPGQPATLQPASLPTAAQAPAAEPQHVAAQPPAPAQLASLAAPIPVKQEPATPPKPAAPTPRPPTLEQEAPVVRLPSGSDLPDAFADDPDHQRFIEPSPNAANLAPDYPSEAGMHGEEGVVVIHMHIDESGRVVRADVAKSSGWPRLDRVARERLATWRFHPALRDGLPIQSDLDQTIDFTLLR